LEKTVANATDWVGLGWVVPRRSRGGMTRESTGIVAMRRD